MKKPIIDCNDRKNMKRNASIRDNAIWFSFQVLKFRQILSMVFTKLIKQLKKLNQ